MSLHIQARPAGGLEETHLSSPTKTVAVYSLGVWSLSGPSAILISALDHKHLCENMQGFINLLSHKTFFKN